jgi:hypothetical protein
MLPTVTEYVLALATLSCANKIETILSYVALPKVAKASKEAVITRAISR